jgi:N-acetylneuraminic acid mutarotase
MIISQYLNKEVSNGSTPCVIPSLFLNQITLNKSYYNNCSHIGGLSYFLYTSHFSTRIVEIFMWQISLSMLASVSIFILVHSTHNITTPFAQGQGLESGWSVGTPMPSPRTEVTTVDLNDGVYVIGGFTSDDKNSAIIEMYNATSDSWRTDIAPLPVPLLHASSVSFQNKIYVVGGYMGNSTPSDRLYIYDPTTNIWTQSNSMPTPRVRLMQTL